MKQAPAEGRGETGRDGGETGERRLDAFTSSHAVPCLSLSSDDRLVSILRHHSFLEELQEIALQGESLSAEDTFAPASAGLRFISSLAGQEGAQRDGGQDAATQAEAVGDLPGELHLQGSTLVHPPGRDRFYPGGNEGI